MPQITNVNRIDPHEIALEIIIPKELVFFDGHFPSFPVVPGVVQIEWALKYGLQFLQLDYHFSGLEAVKFQQLIRPVMAITLLLNYNSDKKKIYFKYFDEGHKYSSGRILLG